jgi:hypothetical protein
MKYTYVVPTGYSDLFKFTNQALNAEIALQVRVQNGWTREDGVSFREEGNLRIVPHSPQSLDWLDSLSNRLENFFTLFLGTSIGIKQVRLVQASKAGSLVYRRRSRKEKISMEMWVRCPFNLVGDAWTNGLLPRKTSNP